MDTIANMFSSIKNAQARHLPQVIIPYSNLKNAIAKVLKQNGFIQTVTIAKNQSFNDLKIELRYSNHRPKINQIKRISKPGCRIYKGYNQIRKVRNGYGLALISTSKGVLSDRQARKQKVGGELIGIVY
ncbi:MAG: 30S ribosomal protein S8 [Candidatus Moranbacteria bacterium]|nr:30S ribosomal protein S8 [Candidatus Moranbacteria bacterium]